MSARSVCDNCPPRLSSSQGELVLVRVTIEPRLLEDLLDRLSGLSFPINPQLFHGVPTRVEFPAYSGYLPEVQEALQSFGSDEPPLQVFPMLEAITAA